MFEQILTLLQNLAKLSPYTIYMTGFLGSLATGTSLGAIFSFCAIIFGSGLNFLLKMLFRTIDPNKLSWMRPSPPSDGCGMFPKCTANLADTDTWGMPSEHSQVVAFAAAFWILYLWRRGQAGFWWSIISTLIIIALMSLVMYSRMVEGCHSLEQVMVGFLFGSILGCSCYFILERNRPELFE